VTASRHVFDLFHQLNQRRPSGKMTRCVVQVGCRMRLIAGRHCAYQLRKRMLQLLSRVHGSQEMAGFKDLLQKNAPLLFLLIFRSDSQPWRDRFVMFR